ncbi:MAG TPA: hypothetical protein VLH10_25435 [Yinghuangia sp.]|uniref:hypothetical protein n=1 Tax=Yinghuangia sp. YIM S10712 TaxID=3436930 RepID=UPI002BF5C772|nr:hypothetical protein [Yinghuangia sp.]
MRAVVEARLVQVRIAGQGCPECFGGVAVPPEKAVALMRANGLEPLEGYPGGNTSWRCRCTQYGAEGRPAYSTVRAGGTGCQRCGKVRAVVSRRAGFADQARAG